MFPASTPTFVFNLKTPDVNLIKDIWVTIKCGNLTMTKTYSENELELDKDNSRVLLKLTEQETTRFMSSEAKLQMKVLFTDDNIAISSVMRIPIEETLNLKSMKKKEEVSP